MKKNSIKKKEILHIPNMTVLEKLHVQTETGQVLQGMAAMLQIRIKELAFNSPKEIRHIIIAVRADGYCSCVSDIEKGVQDILQQSADDWKRMNLDNLGMGNIVYAPNADDN